ncbi:MAG: threonylcarbamoyl-AMP synthase [Euryarchaeota archaeon]|nr:threonylcarbamoyl-AMP synthase [Euryarchaeota archaeon]
MKTISLKVNPRRPSKRKIQTAAEIIRRGGLVAFPTETVYGLGANALDAGAVRKIFSAKGRPLDNPVIVHIAKKEELEKLARRIPKKAKILAERFWPGPLTLVLKKSRAVPKAATAGLDTVAIRMPRNRIALELISASGVPIAAPSANISGRPSPTSAKHVMQDLNGKIDAVIDGGAVDIGLESTVLDMTVRMPTILRPGGVALEELQNVIGRVVLYRKKGKEKPRSPGMKYRHYAPRAELILVGDSAKIPEIAGTLRGKKIGILATKETAMRYTGAVEVVGSRKNLREVARNLFSALRKLDESGVDVIISESFEEKGIGLAIMNRLRKAASRVV